MGTKKENPLLHQVEQLSESIKQSILDLSVLRDSAQYAEGTEDIVLDQLEAVQRRGMDVIEGMNQFIKDMARFKELHNRYDIPVTMPEMDNIKSDSDDLFKYFGSIMKPSKLCNNNTMNTEELNIQDEAMKIHHQYGVTEKANYQIQLLAERYAKEKVQKALQEQREKIVDATIKELFYDRRGLKQVWGSIDDDVKGEIRETILKSLKQDNE